MLSRASICLAVVLLVSAALIAQVSTSRLEGTVEDRSGAIVPGAKIRAVNIKTGISAETTSNERGFYIFPSLLPGEYKVTVGAPGFRTSIHRGVALGVAETVAERFTLEAGQAAQTVELEANAARVRTTDAQIGFAVTLRDIDVLPQLDRKPMTLTLSQPGVEIADTSSRVNGMRQGSNNTKLDGIDVNDAVTPYLTQSMVLQNSDSVGEFRMITTGGKAEYGRNAGAQIGMITRSGTNAWHGNAFDYLRNTVLNASDFFANKTGLPKPKLIQNTFGGSAGGPVRRNRAFIFGNYQGRRTRSEIVSNRQVITPEARTALFRWRDPQTGALRTFDIVANDPRKKGIDPKVADALKLLPAPNNYDIGDVLNTAGFRFNNPMNSYADQMTVRGDYNLTAHHRLFYRHSWGRMWSIDTGGAMYPGQAVPVQASHRWGNSFGSDWTITPQLVNEFRFGRSSYYVAFERPARQPGPMLVNNLWTDPLDTRFGQRQGAPVNEWTDNLSWLKGKHTVKAGADVRLTTFSFSKDGGIWPNVYFGLDYGNSPSGIGPTTGISSADRTRFENLYNDLLGRMSEVYQVFLSDLAKFYPAGTSRIRNFTFHDYGFFVQDDWKLRRNLVISAGLRWEYFGPPHERNGLMGALDKAAQVSMSSEIADLEMKPGVAWYERDRNNFAPRIGFAWDPQGNGKMSVRGSYGVFHDRMISSQANFVDANTPGFARAVLLYPNQAAGSDVRVSDGIPAPAPPPAPQLLLPATRSVEGVSVYNPHLRTGYAQHFSLTIQRELFRNTILDAGYVGTRGVKLFMWLEPDQLKARSDFLDCFRQLQAWVISKTPVPSGNTLVRIFGSADAAVRALGETFLRNSMVSNAAVRLDLNYYPLYDAAGVSQFYLLNYPQFQNVYYGTNDGRSYYDSLQLSLRRQSGALKFAGNYTFSKSLDNISTDGGSYTAPMDNFNLRLSRAIGDLDRRHLLNWALTYTLPVGRGHRFGARMPGWADRLFGGWDMGLLGLWQSGAPFSVGSGRYTSGGDRPSYANYTGSRGIGEVMRRGDGVYYWTPDVNNLFSFPGAGDIGNAGRNVFRGPRMLSLDMSLVKRFRITEEKAIVFRGEAYGLLNNPNFGLPGLNLNNPASLGKISTASGARIFQFALRYEF